MKFFFNFCRHLTVDDSPLPPFPGHLIVTPLCLSPLTPLLSPIVQVQLSLHVPQDLLLVDLYPTCLQMPLFCVHTCSQIIKKMYMFSIFPIFNCVKVIVAIRLESDVVSCQFLLLLSSLRDVCGELLLHIAGFVFRYPVDIPVWLGL